VRCSHLNQNRPAALVLLLSVLTLAAVVPSAWDYARVRFAAAGLWSAFAMARTYAVQEGHFAGVRLYFDEDGRCREVGCVAWSVDGLDTASPQPHDITVLEEWEWVPAEKTYRCREAVADLSGPGELKFAGEPIQPGDRLRGDFTVECANTMLNEEILRVTDKPDGAAGCRLILRPRRQAHPPAYFDVPAGSEPPSEQVDVIRGSAGKWCIGHGPREVPFTRTSLRFGVAIVAGPAPGCRRSAPRPARSGTRTCCSTAADLTTGSSGSRRDSPRGYI
jgi:hypothetical protein